MDVSWRSPLWAVLALVAPVVLVGSTALVGRWIASAGAARRRTRLRRVTVVLGGVVLAVVVAGEAAVAIDVGGGQKPSALLIESSPSDRFVLGAFQVMALAQVAVVLAVGLLLVLVLSAHALGPAPTAESGRGLTRLLGFAVAAGMLGVWGQALYLDVGSLISTAMDRGPAPGLGPWFGVSTLLEVAALAATVIVVVVGHRRPAAKAVGPGLVVVAVVVAELALAAGLVGALSQGWVVRLVLWAVGAWMYGLSRMVLAHDPTTETPLPPSAGPRPGVDVPHQAPPPPVCAPRGAAS